MNFTWFLFIYSHIYDNQKIKTKQEKTHKLWLTWFTSRYIVIVKFFLLNIKFLEKELKMVWGKLYIKFCVDFTEVLWKFDLQLALSLSTIDWMLGDIRLCFSHKCWKEIMSPFMQACTLSTDIWMDR